MAGFSPLRPLLLAAGWLSLALGTLGAFLPLLPTVPLLLLAAACFARSSPRFHRWLLEHPAFGPLVQSYLDGSGIPRRAKRRAILLLWLSLAVSLVLVELTWVRLLLVAVGLGVSAYLWRLPEEAERVTPSTPGEASR